MSSDTGYLALQFIGPMQSWGFDSQYNQRNTSLFPTKSAVAGICCAASGYQRGSCQEKDFLDEFIHINMLSVAIPRFRDYGRAGQTEKKQLEVRRIQDYHTVQSTMRASGTINKDCVLTYRQYLNDASFVIILSGNWSLLEQISTSLKDPVWGVWLGRKSCIPAAPILAGAADKAGIIFDSQADALQVVLGDASLSDFVYQSEVEFFKEGKDSIPDTAVSFAVEDRCFSPRRISVHQPIRSIRKEEQ